MLSTIVGLSHFYFKNTGLLLTTRINVVIAITVVITTNKTIIFSVRRF